MSKSRYERRSRYADRYSAPGGEPPTVFTGPYPASDLYPSATLYPGQT